MTQPTVTLREAAQQALDALEYHTEQTRPISKTEKALVALRAALDAPAAVDCRWCKRFAFCSANTYNDQRFENCTDFDKYTPLHEATALPPIVLTKVTK